MKIRIDRPGRAKRADNYAAVSQRVTVFTQVAERFRETGRDLPTVYEITTLIWRAGSFLTYTDDQGRERPLSATHIRLLAILLTYTNAKDWADGHPVAFPGNARLAAMLDIDETYVSRLLRQLEAAGCLLRQYTWKNRRHGAGGLNLAPLYSLIPVLRTSLEDLDATLVDRRAAADSLDQEEYYQRKPEKISRIEYKNEVSGDKGTPNAVSVDYGENVDAEGGKPPKSIFAGRSAPDSASLRDIALQQEWRSDLANITHPAIIQLLVQYSSVFRWNLKKLFEIDDPFKATHVQILELVRFVKDKHFSDMRDGLWLWALDNHGVNAILAMFYALETENIRTTRLRFLAGMLKKAPDDRTMNPAEGMRRAAEISARRAREDGQYH